MYSILCCAVYACLHVCLFVKFPLCVYMYCVVVLFCKCATVVAVWVMLDVFCCAVCSLVYYHICLPFEGLNFCTFRRSAVICESLNPRKLTRGYISPA